MMMTTTTIFIILPATMIGLLVGISSANTIEVCYRDTISVNCSSDEVISVDSARYGRMRKGKCVTTEDHVNCSADVKLYLEHRCAGRRQCDVSPDDNLDAYPHRCHPDLKTYLELTYHCLRVESPRTRSDQCPEGAYFVRPTASSGFLARIATVETGIGSSACPWVISVQSGQTVTLKLLDFGIWRTQKTNQSIEGTCRVYLRVSDRTSSGRPSIVCGGTRVQERERTIYTSNTNSVQLSGISTAANNDYFTIKYEVVGCPDITPPLYSSVERSGDRLVIRCNEGGGGGKGGGGGGGEGELESVLTCVDGNWSGPALINCSAIGLKSKEGTEKSSFQGVLMVVVISAAVIVVVLIATVAIFVFYQQRAMKRNSSATITIPPPGSDYYFTPDPSFQQTWPLSRCTTATTAPSTTTGSQQGIRLLHDNSRRPSTEGLDRDDSTLRAMRPPGRPGLGHSASLSSFRQMPLVYDASNNGGNTMLMYCPYHGTITRVPGTQQQKPGVPVSHSHGDIVSENQFIHPDVYHELDYDMQPMSPDSTC